MLSSCTTLCWMQRGIYKSDMLLYSYCFLASQASELVISCTLFPNLSTILYPIAIKNKPSLCLLLQNLLLLLHCIRTTTPIKMNFSKHCRTQVFQTPSTKASGAGEIKFPKRKRFVTIYNLFKKYNVLNLPNNKSWGSKSIMSCIQKSCKLVDKTDVFASFTSCAREESTSQVYILHNDEKYFGFDLILTLYFI